MGRECGLEIVWNSLGPVAADSRDLDHREVGEAAHARADARELAEGAEVSQVLDVHRDVESVAQRVETRRGLCGLDPVQLLLVLHQGLVHHVREPDQRRAEPVGCERLGQLDLGDAAAVHSERGAVHVARCVARCGAVCGVC